MVSEAVRKCSRRSFTTCTGVRTIAASQGRAQERTPLKASKLGSKPLASAWPSCKAATASCAKRYAHTECCRKSADKDSEVVILQLAIRLLQLPDYLGSELCGLAGMTRSSVSRPDAEAEAVASPTLCCRSMLAKRTCQEDACNRVARKPKAMSQFLA